MSCAGGPSVLQDHVMTLLWLIRFILDSSDDFSGNRMQALHCKVLAECAREWKVRSILHSSYDGLAQMDSGTLG